MTHERSRFAVFSRLSMESLGIWCATGSTTPPVIGLSTGRAAGAAAKSGIISPQFVTTAGDSAAFARGPRRAATLQSPQLAPAPPTSPTPQGRAPWLYRHHVGRLLHSHRSAAISSPVTQTPTFRFRSHMPHSQP